MTNAITPDFRVYHKKDWPRILGQVADLDVMTSLVLRLAKLSSAMMELKIDKKQCFSDIKLHDSTEMKDKQEIRVSFSPEVYSTLSHRWEVLSKIATAVNGEES